MRIFKKTTVALCVVLAAVFFAQNAAQAAPVAYSPYHTVVVNSFLLGGYDKDGWIDSQTLFPKLAKTDNYKVYEDGKYISTEKGAKKSWEDSSEAGGLSGSTIVFSKYDGVDLYDKNILAVSGGADPFIRETQTINPTNRSYGEGQGISDGSTFDFYFGWSPKEMGW